ncbi:unnamed protein product [Nesidiocoris tenuis]|uniref:ABC transporter domain-containing protein n=1 Tax=Nesidiocoris tenuis TaxID=355587 RepID=A0A6H5H7Z3_9HEMI|nr:unnamed protein product [Nesidiocoris tenuis]
MYSMIDNVRHDWDFRAGRSVIKKLKDNFLRPLELEMYREPGTNLFVFFLYKNSYGFLGPSGCGKTTLLSCIVGRTSLDAGSISLTVKSRANIGYMPQELALSKEFKISELMSYYGLLYGMSRAVLKKRKEELYALLDLPPEEKIIEKLSGGQQRRTSLCVALLHDPELLILDEPTCGVDPLLSHSIVGFLLLLPIVQCFLFQLTVGRDPDELQMGFINKEVRNWRDNCYDFANESCILDYGFASCKFLDKLTGEKVKLVSENIVVEPEDNFGRDKAEIWMKCPTVNQSVEHHLWRSSEQKSEGTKKIFLSRRIGVYSLCYLRWDQEPGASQCRLSGLWFLEWHPWERYGRLLVPDPTVNMGG